MYTPTTPPDGTDTRHAIEWVFQELLKLAGVLSNLEQGVFLDLMTSAPAKPHERQIVFADGTSWNPGSGKGVYVYYNSSWHFLG